MREVNEYRVTEPVTKLHPYSSPLDRQPADIDERRFSVYVDSNLEPTLYGTDQPLEGGSLLTTKEIEEATEAKVFFPNTASQYEDVVSVDLPAVQAKLEELGFDKRHTDGLAVVIQDPQAKPDRHMDRVGWYTGNAYRNEREEGVLNYPLAVHVVYTGDERQMNKTLRHELGHAKRDKVDGDTTDALYWDAKKVAKVRGIAMKAGAAGALVGGLPLVEAASTGNETLDSIISTSGIVLTGAAAIVAAAPEKMLKAVDPSERYANRFARRHKELNPITLAKEE